MFFKFFFLFSFQAPYFQKISTANERIKTGQNVLSNREFMPRLCLNVKTTGVDQAYDVKIIFNDIHHVAHSTLLGTPAKYILNLYSYKDPNKSIYDLPIQSKLIFSASSPLSLSDSITITNLKQQKYLIEVNLLLFLTTFIKKTCLCNCFILF
jgi:hypothetical protein